MKSVMVDVMDKGLELVQCEIRHGGRNGQPGCWFRVKIALLVLMDKRPELSDSDGSVTNL